jgi:sensor histidine kinase YesM
MVPEWGVLVQLVLFALQATMLTFIWHLVKSLNSFLDKRIPFSQGPLMRVTLQIALTMLIVAPILITITYLMSSYLPVFVNSQFIGFAIGLFVIMIFLFNFAFYSYYFFSNWQQSIEEKAKLEVQTAELEREKFNLQYHQLKNQVNPHYLFNTLTSLDGLIQTNPDLASEFVRHMSKVYRYVLQHKENEVVSLDEELEFIGHYIELLHIRYGAGLNIHHNLSPAALDRGIVMVTLQMLIDNAIKHNIIQSSPTLKIIIWDEDGYLVVYNNKQLRKQIETSNGHGIKQLMQLYGYLSDRPVIIDNTDEHFIIKIPLL